MFQLRSNKKIRFRLQEMWSVIDNGGKCNILKRGKNQEDRIGSEMDPLCEPDASGPLEDLLCTLLTPPAVASIFIFCYLPRQVHRGSLFSDPICPSWFLPLMIYFKLYITLEPTNKWSYDAKKSTHSNDVFGPVDASVSEGMRKWCCYICLCVWNHQSQCCWGTWRKEAYIPGISYESNKYYKSWRYQHRPISMLVAVGEYQI